MIFLASGNSTCDLSDYPPYKVSNNMADFDSAQACCQSMNMTLVEIDSVKKLTRLMNMSIFTQFWFYIRLDGRCADSNYTKWLSGKQVTYTNWETGKFIFFIKESYLYMKSLPNTGCYIIR
jgi:hypothetical protein